MQINVYSHGIEVCKVREHRERLLLMDFCRPLIQYELKKIRGRFVKAPARVYAVATADKSCFRFHVNQLNELLDFLAVRGLKENEDFKVKRHELSTDDFPQVVLKWKSPKMPRGPQPGIIEEVLKPGANKMVALQTGGGKTFIALWVGKELGLRSAYMFKGGYVGRWMEAFEEYYDLEPGDIYVARGSAGLIRLMEDALEDKITAKIFVFTNRTMYDYLKDYRDTNGRSKTYPIKPGEFFQKLGIGYVVKDELHQEFHFNYRMDLFTHTLKSLSLSATLESTDMFMERVYDIAYPVTERISGGAYNVYIAVTALHYQLEHPERVKTIGAMGGYSHNTYETSIMRQPKLLASYMRMFDWVVKVQYDAVMEPGQKMLVFCASVQMCELVRDHLRKTFPHYTINKYTEEDPYSVLLDSDIAVSTVLSAGTAVDIPKLLHTFMSTAVDSIKSNKQALGRTRPFEGRPDITPGFTYAVCTSIPKHVDYHKNKEQYFRGKVVSHLVRNLPFKI